MCAKGSGVPPYVSKSAHVAGIPITELHLSFFNA